MPTFPAADYISDAARTEGEVKQALEDWLAATKQLPGGAAISTLTIASGAVTPTGPVHRIDTEAAAATDDLANIATTNLPEGSLLLLTNANAGRVVVVKHAAGGAGQLALKMAGDFTLADPDKHWLLAMRIGADWTEILRAPTPMSGVVTRTSNTILTAADIGKLIDVTSGTFTQTFEACATLGKGWWVAVKNSGSGIVTLDPNASETIDVTIVNPGDELLIVCDGTNLKTYGRFNANDTQSTVASATTPDIWTGTGNVIDYTGTTTATGFAAAPCAGARRTLVCAAAAVFTAGANLLIQGVSSGSNYTAAAGDIIHVVAITTTQFRLTILKANGHAVVSTPPALIRKPSTETVTGSTTLQADDHLLAALAANETVIFEMHVRHVGNTTADFKFAVSAPSGAAGWWGPGAYLIEAGPGTATTMQTRDTFDNSTPHTQNGSTDSTGRGLVIRGLVRNGATPGNLQLYWAQGTADGVNTQVLFDSYMIVWRY